MARHEFYRTSTHGFQRLALAVPKVILGDPDANAAGIIDLAKQAVACGADICAFPELSISGYSLDDIFRQRVLLRSCLSALATLKQANRKHGGVWIVGAPLEVEDQLYNCALVLAGGNIRGVAVKTFLPQYHEFYEKRQFASATRAPAFASILGQDVPFGNDLIFQLDDDSATDAKTKFAIEICEDAWVAGSVGDHLALGGAQLIINVSASPVLVDKSDIRNALVMARSATQRGAYAMVAAGYGESTTDLSWDGHAMICELGDTLAERRRLDLSSGLLMADVDMERIARERFSVTSFGDAKEFANVKIKARNQKVSDQKLDQKLDQKIRKSAKANKSQKANAKANMASKTLAGGVKLAQKGHEHGREHEREHERVCRLIAFDVALVKRGEKDTLMRPLARLPFVGIDADKAQRYAEEIFHIQSQGLLRRMQAARAKVLLVGLSGGIDSAHALLVAHHALEQGGQDASRLMAVIMPGPATSKATTDNALSLAKSLGVKVKVIDICDAVSKMLSDIDHPLDLHDKTFENVQAGLRTDYLFRLAGKHGGLVVGTGDLSELALGWCTFGVGDQMAHYNVNAGLPKTLIIRVMARVAQVNKGTSGAAAVLRKILSTTISPELVPSQGDKLQSTEDMIGPYVLNDFFLYHTLRDGTDPVKLAFLCWQAWGSAQRGEWPKDYDFSAHQHKKEYSLQEIKFHLENFYRRFITNQFKRSTLPNGPKVVSAGSLSPRGDWRCPSDLDPKIWLDALARGLPDK